ncbi:MAG: LamG-like jellyroll fold domain-containing protein [Actinomycetota bacterium]
MKALRIGLAAFTILVTGAIPSSASTLRADWRMSERHGATVMRDSSGHHINGSIGSHVLVGGGVYRWPFRSPTEPPAEPERIVKVGHRDVLNPGTGFYAVEFRYRTAQPFGNMIQKGQAGASGGYFKIENPNGIIRCAFRGRKKDGTWGGVVAKSPTALSDGTFHTIRCERRRTSVKMYVDGVLRVTRHGNTGKIANARPITFGGKLNCDNVKRTCDYFTGTIDYVRIYTP